MTCEKFTEAKPHLHYVLRNLWPSLAVKACGAFSRHVNESRKSTWIWAVERSISSEKNTKGRAGTHKTSQKTKTEKMQASKLTNPTFVKIANTICRQKTPLDEPVLHNVDGDVYDPYIVIIMTQLWRRRMYIGIKMPKEKFLQIYSMLVALIMKKMDLKPRSFTAGRRQLVTENTTTREDCKHFSICWGYIWIVIET